MADLSDAASLLTSTIITQERLISARETEVNQLRGKLAEAEDGLEVMKQALASYTEALALVTPVVELSTINLPQL